MDLSVAQGRPGQPEVDETGSIGAARLAPAVIGGLLAVIALGVYLVTQVDRFYDHFVWQAAAFLEGHAAIRYPAAPSAGSLGNAFFQDVLPVVSGDGVARGLIPFPPLPAVLLVPFVALFGLATDDQTIFTTLAAVAVAICWWMLGQLRVRRAVRLGTTVFFAFGTVFWYTAQLATTWYQAHIVAVGLTMLAVGLAIRADPSAAGAPTADDDAERTPVSRLLRVEPRQFLVGLLFGLACTARLSIVAAAPFFMLVGAGGGWWRRSWSAGLGAAIPIVLLLAYNVIATGHVFHPAYQHLYQLEARAYTALGYHAEWSVEDPRYLPQNLRIMLLATPEVLPDRLQDTLGTLDQELCTEPGASRGLFDAACPFALPRDIGMSIVLTSPAFLLAVPALRGVARGNRLVRGAVLAVVLVSLVNLMHFSQGWVQFGYRFSNDAVPFALVLVALGTERLAGGGRRWAMPVAMALITVSIAINAWGVVWATRLGW